MLRVHCTNHRGAKELLKILREHCQRSGIPRYIHTDGWSIFCAQEVKDFCKWYDIEHNVFSVSTPHANLRSEVSVTILKRMRRDVVSSSGSLDNDAVTEALLCYANTKCRVLKKLPAELSLGRCLMNFFPRQVSSLVPFPANLMSGTEKDRLQEKIKLDAGQRWSEHTKVLQPLNVGEWVQLQNLKGSHPLNSDYSGEIVGRHNINSYAVKVNGTGKVTVRNRASLRKIPAPVPIHMPMTEQAPAPAPVPAPVPADRPAHGPRSESAVLSVPSVVTRSSLKARQNSMVPEGQNEGPRNQALYDKKCESMMHQVANMDYPGNILKVLRKPSAQSSNVADS